VECDVPARAPDDRWPSALVLIGYAVLALGMTRSWWTPLGGRTTAVNETDAALFSWLLGWTPHALGTGQLPLFTDRLNFPTGVNLMWNNGMLLPGILFAPVTLAFGGTATVTVLCTLGPALSAASAYACLRALPRPGPKLPVLPAALGGALFGFSPAVTAQALGHPNLVFNPLLPVLLLLSLRLMLDEHPSRRTAVLLGAAAGVQVLIGEEMLFLTGVVVALLLAALAVGHPAVARRRWRRFSAAAMLALGVFALVAGFPLGYQLLGPLRQHGSPFATAYYSVDLASYVLPNELQALGGGPARPFPGGLEEHTAYLGWPLLLFALAGLVLARRRPWIRVPLLVASATAVLALGPQLTVLGQPTGVPLPWALLRGLPGFEHVIVTRFALLTAGLLGVALAVALHEAMRGRPLVRRYGLAAGVLALLPLLPAALPGMPTPAVPAFFTGPAVTDVACPGGSLLVLPFPRAGVTDAMRWQQAAEMAFAMPGGYFIGPGPNGRAYVHGAPTRTGLLLQDVLRDGQARPVTAQLSQDFRADVQRWRACAAVLGPSRHQDALRAQLTALTGREPAAVDGVFLWRDLGGP
jgi:hypothetical protein